MRFVVKKILVLASLAIFSVSGIKAMEIDAKNERVYFNIKKVVLGPEARSFWTDGNVLSIRTRYNHYLGNEQFVHDSNTHKKRIDTAPYMTDLKGSLIRSRDNEYYITLSFKYKTVCSQPIILPVSEQYGEYILTIKNYTLVGNPLTFKMEIEPVIK